MSKTAGEILGEAAHKRAQIAGLHRARLVGHCMTLSADFALAFESGQIDPYINQAAVERLTKLVVLLGEAANLLTEGMMDYKPTGKPTV